MFPKESHLAQRAESSTNGFTAILALMTDSHPAFVAQPITLAMNWPIQDTHDTVFDFYTKFLDHIRLRAIFTNSADNMASTTMVDCFLNNCSHSGYLLHVSRFDRQDPTKKGLFEPGALAITINTYLSNPDSPTQKKRDYEKKPFREYEKKPFVSKYGEGKFGDSSNKPNYPYCRRVNALIDSLTEDDHSDSPINFGQYADYIIHQVTNSDPTQTNPCILCREDAHKFDACPLLNNDEFMKGFIIKLVTGISRELRQGRNKLKTANARINQILAEHNPSSTTDDDPDKPDFP
jgi:hypothetical protein